MTQGVAQKKLNQSAVESCSSCSRHGLKKLIVRMVDEADCDAVTQLTAIEQALKQSTAQRQNILRAAFTGQLVPQDPNDEPASVLLARIRAERAAQTAMHKPLAAANEGRKTRHEN